ncbi:MAG: NADH-quinone oxidoreductase subunit D [Nitrospirae bacterium]|nr:NADH-quinone oxidoreductase subunit D [Nitrospirota bacterium]
MIRTEEFTLNMGPVHPSTHGILRLIIKMSGEVVTEIDPDLGFLHRGVEKMGENLTYPEFVIHTDRLDYVNAMNNNHAYVLAVERLGGLTVPERAEYLRVITAELNRIASHLFFIATTGMDLGNFTILLHCFRDREMILHIFEKICGARLTYSYFRLGGVGFDFPPGMEQDILNFTAYLKTRLPDYDRLLTDNYIFQKRLMGVGVLSREDAINWGTSGPVLRGSGVQWDIRRNDPYSVYDRFDFEIPTGKNGDCWDRYMVRVLEIRESIKIVEQACKNIPAGDIRSKVSRIFKPPAGEVYSRVEVPKGELGFYIVSQDKSTKPYRIHIKAPSFVNLSSIIEVAKGCLIADVVAILANYDIVLGEIDR